MRSAPESWPSGDIVVDLGMSGLGFDGARQTGAFLPEVSEQDP